MNSLSQHTVAGLEQRTLLTNYADYVTTFETTLEETLPPVGTIGWFDGIAKYPEHGTLTPLPGGSFRYEPDDGYAGPDYFEYKFHEYIDYGEGTPTENDFILPVGIVVYLPPPEAYDDSSFDWEDPVTGQFYQGINYFVLKGNSLTISREDGVLKNDIDWRVEDNWDTLSAVSVTGTDPYSGQSLDPRYGSVSLGSDGSFSYTPFSWVFDDPNFEGVQDRFYYYVEDDFGGTSSTAMVTVDLAELFIARNGTDLDESPDLLSVWVGEKVVAAVGVKGQVSLIPGATSIQWCMSGEVVDGYTGYGDGYFGENEGDPDSEGEGHSLAISATELNNSSIDFYWIAGGTEELTVSVSTIGQTSYAEKELDIRRPSVSVTVLTSGLRIVDNNWVSFSAPGSEGITFTRSLDALADTLGEYRWTQLITKDNYTWKDANGNFHTGHKTLGIDNFVTYQIGNEVEATDSPGAPLPATWIEASRDFGASMYLMWKHQSDDSIWVSLSVTDWGYYSEAVQQNGSWTLSPTSRIVPPITQSTSSLPEWSSFFLNDEDVTEDN